MRRSGFAVLAAILTCGGGLAAADKGSKNSRPAVRPELALPPVAPANPPGGIARPSPYNFPGVEFPRIEADNRVTFRFTAPNAQKDPAGAWTYATTTPQSPGYHNSWMFVDGATVLDPGTQTFIGYGHTCNKSWCHVFVYTPTDNS